MAAGNAYGGSLDYAKKRAELLIAAQKAGLDLTPDQIAGLEDLARAYAESGIAAAAAADNMQRIESSSARGRDAITDFLDEVIVKGGSARRAIASLLAEMASVQLRRAVVGASGGGSIFGSLFSGIGKLLSYDGGGYTGSAPRSGGLDGKGGFLAMLHPRETVIDHTRGSGGLAAPQQQRVDVRVSVDQNGQLQAFVDQRAVQMASRLDLMQAQAQQRAMPGAIRDMQARGLR